MGEKRPDIRVRSFDFAARIMRLVQSLARERNVASDVVIRQLARSGTSVGANVEEAQGAHSKADFAHRMNIARREARETHYWLRLIAELELVPPERLTELVQESDVIVRILTATVKTARGARSES